jgi:hypothetical protein
LILHQTQQTPAIIGVLDDFNFHGFVARALRWDSHDEYDWQNDFEHRT